MGEQWFQLGMAADDAAKLLLKPVQPADVVAVAVGNHYRGDTRLAQFRVEILNLFGPGSVRFARVHHHHVVVGVAHKIDVSAAGVHGPKGAGIFFNVGGVDILGNLHWPAHPRKFTA